MPVDLDLDQLTSEEEGISKAVLIFAIVGHLMNDVNFGVKSGHSIPGGIVWSALKWFAIPVKI